MPFLTRVRSDKDTHFTGAIAQNAQEQENLSAGSALGTNATGVVRALVIISDQNLDWEVTFWAKDTFNTADADTDTYLGNVVCTASTDAKQIAATGLYRYSKTGLAIPIRDDDATGEVHVSLINRSATGKNAGASGEVVVELQIELLGS